ncbi:cation:proton antiporter [Candidatus Woesearchaeota archaeon]|nr:cation:proton antiporter [Candidatus Woesearchaeota archaeon]
MDIFIEIGIIIIFASILAFVSRMFKQPLIPAYIIGGIILGPLLSIVTNKSIISTLSEIGIAFLLFIVGLEINLKNLKEVGFVSSIGGVINSTILFSLGFIVSLMMGFEAIEAGYLGLIIAFSSTMVVIKQLSDSREVNTLHGRIIIGILLVEDLIAVVAITILNSMHNISIAVFIFSILKGGFLFLLIMLLSKHVLNHLFKFAAKTPEVLFLLSISVCFMFGIFFSEFGHILVFLLRDVLSINLSEHMVMLLSPGFSIAIGAFAAGIGLANLPYSIEITSKVKPLKDFFATIFFVSLGLELEFGVISKQFIPIFVITLIVMFIKPSILFFMTYIFGYKQRTSFLVGGKMSQISEFALIIVFLGISLDHVSSSIVNITITIAIITIVFTSYFENYKNQLYNFFSPYLKLFDKIPLKTTVDLENVDDNNNHEVILVGYDRIGYSIFNTLKKLKKKFLVVDFNPEVVRNLIAQNVSCIYGDIGDIEVINKLDLGKVRIIISTVPHWENNLLLISETKKLNNEATIFVTADHVDEALSLYDAGADYVILPHFLGGERVSFILEDYTEDFKSITDLIAKKVEHIKELRRRKSLGHYHPNSYHLS